MATSVSLVDFLVWTGGTYQVTSTYRAGKEQEVHTFRFPNESCIVSPPGRDYEAALRDAIEFVCSQVSLPTANKAAV